MIVGEAELVIRANTTGLKSDIAAQTDASLAGADLATKGEHAGEDLGAGLTAGMGRGTEHLAEDATKKVETETGKMKGLMNDLSAKASNSLQGFGVPASLLKGPSIIALGFAGVSAVALKMSSDLQSADAKIAASSGQTVQAVTKIGDAFLTTGGKTEFSATEMANAFAQVAGQLKTTEGHALTASQSLTFMKTATDLATASGNDLMTTTQTLGGILQAFQLDAGQAAGAANVLFNASNATGQNLSTLASSLERVRSKLGDTSPPLAQLTALMVDMTKNGITGRAALTGLNTAMTALMGAATGTTKTNLTARQTLADYGIAAKNAAGQLTPMSVIIDKLAPKFATMTQAQQLSTATAIFGASSAKAMTAVIDGGTKSYDAATAAVTKHNAVTTAAQIQEKTLRGEIELLKTDVVDIATKLGNVLVPAFTAVTKAILPVITDVVNLVGWFEKGSAPAIAIAGILTATVAPAIIKMGVSAATSAAKSVIAFVTMQGSAQTTAATVQTADTKIEASNATAGGSFTAMSEEAASAVPMIGTAMTGMVTEVEAGNAKIEASNVVAGDSYVALAGKIGLIGLAAVAAAKLTENLNTVGQKNVPLWKKIDPVTLFANGMTELANGLHHVVNNITGDGGTSATHKKGLPKISDSALSAAERATAEHRGTTSTKATTKHTADAYIPPPTTTSTKAKSAATTTAEKAMSTLASEVGTAIALPFAQGVDQLRRLGVPAAKAALVLRDAVLPFNQAVTALEKAGFDAAEAVKLADAGTKKNTAEAKAAATAATKAAKTTSVAGGTSGVTVNGIQVSGAVYDAAIGSAFKTQTGSKAAGLTGNGSITPTGYGAIGGPSAPTPPTINVSPGAIVVNPAPGNDSNSLLVTHGMLEEVLTKIVTELQSGVNALGITTA